MRYEGGWGIKVGTVGAGAAAQSGVKTSREAEWQLEGIA